MLFLNFYFPIFIPLVLRSTRNISIFTEFVISSLSVLLGLDNISLLNTEKLARLIREEDKPPSHFPLDKSVFST